MNIPYTDSIFLGIIRLGLWIVFFYVIKRLFFKGNSNDNQVKSMMRLWVYYGSMTLVGIFILVQFNAYDQFTIILIILLLIITKFLRVRDFLFNRKLWNRARKMMLIRVIENVEDNDPMIDTIHEEPVKRLSPNAEFAVMGLICVIAVLVRFYLIQFDNYQLSQSWFRELEAIKSFTQQQWFRNDLSLNGEYAFMNFYSMMTGISPEIALESFGLLQAFIVCFMIFWFVNVMTNSKFTIPVFAALIFALFFNLTPVDLTQLSHSKQTFMALTFALPAMSYSRRPWLLFRKRSKSFIPMMTTIFAAIALIDLFTLFILFPVFLFVSFFFILDGYRKYYFKTWIAYFIGSGSIMICYAYAAYINNIDFLSFIETNLLSVSATTSTSNMLVSYSTLLSIIQIISLITVIPVAFLFRKNRNKWAGPLAYLVYINVLIFISLIGYIYFDSDLFNEVLLIFIPCGIAIVFYVVEYYFSKVIFHIHVTEWVSVPIEVIILGSIAYFSQGVLLGQNVKNNKLSKNLIAAYEDISANYLAYSYAVSNLNALQPISTNSHNFISYDEFTSSYTERDSVFFANKEDEDFLRLNTEYILPSSLLVFIYNTELMKNTRFSANPQVMQKVKDQLKSLENKGRSIRKIAEYPTFSIYEIINTPKGSRVDDML